MTERTNHPDFDAAPDELQWTGTLPKLAEVLKHDAYQAQGEWVQRILPGGALVCMRIRPETFQKELRIARRLRKPFTDKSAKAWATERTTFLRELGCEKWECLQGGLLSPAQAHLNTPGKIECLYLEKAPLGASPNTLVCHRCKEDFDPGPKDRIYAKPTCNKCAMAAGQEFTETKRREREAT